MRREFAWIGVMIAVLAAAAALVAARQGRDTGAPSAVATAADGTAALAGVLVTDAPTPTPVRRAVMRLSGAAGTNTRLVGTDDAGQFVFVGLPAGSFTLSATKPGFVQTFYGSTHPGRGPGVPIALANGAHVDVTLKLLPGAIITGVVTDARGNPAAAIPISAVPLRAAATTAVPSRTTSDDRGVYRLFGLAPGDYVVSAIPRLLPISGGRGVATADIVAVTDAEVQWARRASAGGPTGLMPAASGAMPPPGRLIAYAPVYYPGNTDASAAVRVSVAAGEERSNVGFALQIAPMARITGSVVDANEQVVASATLSLYPRRGDQLSVADVLVSSGTLVLPRATASSSGFAIAGVAPGDYTLLARSGSGQRLAVGAPAAIPLWSVTDLSVAGADQTDLVIHLLPGLRLTGSIAFDRASLTPPGDLSAAELVLMPTGSLAGALPSAKAIVDANGAFRFASIAPGTYTLSAAPPNASGGRWTLKSALLNGRDLADGAFEVRRGDIDGLVVTFTDHAASIAGRLTDASGVPITRYSIVLATVDRSLWLPSARRVRATRPATDGSFTIAGLPPGDYAIAAVQDVEAADLADPAFLAQISASGLKLSLGEGERKTQDLRAVR